MWRVHVQEFFNRAAPWRLYSYTIVLSVVISMATLSLRIVIPGSISWLVGGSKTTGVVWSYFWSWQTPPTQWKIRLVESQLNDVQIWKSSHDPQAPRTSLYCIVLVCALHVIVSVARLLWCFRTSASKPHMTMSMLCLPSRIILSMRQNETCFSVYTLDAFYHDIVYMKYQQAMGQLFAYIY